MNRTNVMNTGDTRRVLQLVIYQQDALLLVYVLRLRFPYLFVINGIGIIKNHVGSKYSVSVGAIKWYNLAKPS